MTDNRLILGHICDVGQMNSRCYPLTFLELRSLLTLLQGNRIAFPLLHCQNPEIFFGVGKKRLTLRLGGFFLKILGANR